jgi:hypothetical protein
VGQISAPDQDSQQLQATPPRLLDPANPESALLGELRDVIPPLVPDLAAPLQVDL